jgi:hypothetical protein
MVLLAGCPGECGPAPEPPAAAPAVVAGSSQPAPPGSAFSEEFTSPAAFDHRFDHGWSGEWNAGALFGAAINDWRGDHDASCGNPHETQRTVHLTANSQDQAFYACLPGDDPAKGHVMTSVNTEGYAIAWFSPKQVFNNVRRVCWDQNLTDLGGGKWTQVVLVAEPQARAHGGDLGYTGPGFQDPSGPTTQIHASNPADIGGAKVFQGGFEIWRGGDVTGSQDYWSYSGGPGTQGFADKAARFQHCMVDNEDGSVTISQARPDGRTYTQTVRGDLPDGPVRVVFQDDNYNPDKHDGTSTPSDARYTWHWDNIQIG